MYYTNELISSPYKTKEELLKVMRERNIVDPWQLSEVMSSDGPKSIERPKVSVNGTIQIMGKEVQVTIYTHEDPWSVKREIKTVPAIDHRLIRTNKKKGIEGVTLTKSMLFKNKEFKKLDEEYTQKINEEKRKRIADLVMDLREKGLVNKEKLAAVELQLEYEKVPEEEKVQWLEDHGFTGIENLGAYESHPDGFGHTTGYCTNIDFKNRTINIIGFSSDD